MKKFEYLSRDINGRAEKLSDFNRVIAELGNQGWELCCIVDTGLGHSVSFFKREIQDDEEQKQQRVLDTADAVRWRKLKDLCGYVQNGSDTTVKLSQDDATRTCYIHVGNKSYDGNSFNSVLADIPDPEH